MAEMGNHQIEPIQQQQQQQQPVVNPPPAIRDYTVRRLRQVALLTENEMADYIQQLQLSRFSQNQLNQLKLNIMTLTAPNQVVFRQLMDPILVQREKQIEKIYQRRKQIRSNLITVFSVLIAVLILFKPTYLSIPENGSIQKVIMQAKDFISIDIGGGLCLALIIYLIIKYTSK